MDWPTTWLKRKRKNQSCNQKVKKKLIWFEKIDKKKQKNMAEEGRNLDATTLEDHDDSISQPNTNTEPNETSIEDREDMLATHRREDKDLQKEIQKLKKSVTQGEKKKKKEV